MINQNYNNDFQLFCNIWKNEEETNKLIYERCYEHSDKIEFLKSHFTKTQIENDMAFSELAFRYLWLILLNELKDESKLLEIGVFKGATISLFKLISNHLNKNFKIYGLTPLDTTGDKFSNYRDSDFLKDIEFVHSLFNLNTFDLNIIKGLSTDESIKDKIRKDKFDLVYIDGGHDFESVINDINLTDEILNVGGFMVADDSSFGLSFPNGFIGFKGHIDVFMAFNQSEIIKNKYQHLFACGHIRCWRKIK